MKICYQKNRKGAAKEQRMQRPTADFKSNTMRMQKQKEKFEYGMD